MMDQSVKTYRMSIVTEDPKTGRPRRETVPHLTAEQVAEGREHVRTNQPTGSTYSIRVTEEQ